MPRKKAEPVVENTTAQPETINVSQTLYHATMFMGVLANSLQEQKGNMLTAIGNGKMKNNKFNEGYMTALDDMRIVISDIIKSNLEVIQEEVSVKEEANENAD